MPGEPQAFRSGWLSAVSDTFAASGAKNVLDLGTLVFRALGETAMGIYLAATYPRGYDYPISTLVSGAVILVALFVICLLAGKAIEWVRDRHHFDTGAVEDGQPKDPEDPWERAISRPSGDYYDFGGHYGDEMGGLAGMNQREQEELFSTDAPRKVRKTMKARRRAREQAAQRRRRH